MLDGFERNDRIEACRRERQRGDAATDKAERRAIGLRFGGMRDRRCIDVDADDGVGYLADKRASVTFAAGDVEYPSPHGKPARKNVAVPVLVRDLAFGSRHEPLASEFEGIRHRFFGVPRPPRRRGQGGEEPGILADDA